MKYLKQFGIILFVSLLGELLRMLIPLPIPASVYGLVLMLILLMTGIIKLQQIKEVCFFNRNHAGYVYSGRRGTFRIMAVTSPCMDSGSFYFCSYYDYCNGSNWASGSENYRKGGKKGWKSFSLILSFLGR